MVKKTAREVTEDKTSRIMNAVALWASFYRANPQRFCKDYLNVKPEDVPTDFDLLHGAMHKFLFYSGAWSTLGPQVGKPA